MHKSGPIHCDAMTVCYTDMPVRLTEMEYNTTLKILPNAYKMARAGQQIDTSFSSYYYSFAKSG